jgi:PPOX class probable F420-dependent enzyme
MNLTPEESRRRFAEAKIARLATITPNNHPHIIPVTFAIQNSTLYIAIDHKPKTTKNLQRLKNIEQNPKVSILADHYTEDWTTLWWTRADGTATITDEETPIDLLVAKYSQYQETRPQGPVIEIKVNHWTGWTYT